MYGFLVKCYIISKWIFGYSEEAFWKKKLPRDSEKIFLTGNVKSCVSHIFRIEYSGSSPQLKPHTSRRSSSEKLYVFQKQFSCHCALRKSRWVMCLSFFLQNRLLHFSVWEEHRQSIASNFVVGPTVCLIYVLGIWPYGMAYQYFD